MAESQARALSPGALRRLVVIVLTVLAVGAMFAAWWFLPEPRDLERDLTPAPGAVQVPPLPPANAGDTDTDSPPGEAMGDDTGMDGGAALGLDTDARVALRRGELGETEDGVPLRLPPGRAWLAGATAPAEGRVVSLALSDQAVMSEVRGPDGSFVQVLTPDVPERRVVALTGVSEPGRLGARARSPVWTGEGWALLADGPTGPGVWTVDLDSMVAAPMEPVAPVARRLEHLRADNGTVAVVADDSRVWVRQETDWSVLEQGPGGLDGLAIGAGSLLATSRNGRISLKLPTLTVGATVGQGREPVLPVGGTAWVRGSEVVVLLPGSERPIVVGTAVTLVGTDLVAAGSQVLWVRPDGALGRATLAGATVRVDAVLVPLDRITALGAVSVGTSTRVAVAGRAGAVQRIEVWELPEGSE